MDSLYGVEEFDEIARFEALFGKTETKPADMGFVFCYAYFHPIPKETL
jgi:hypothetical protein